MTIHRFALLAAAAAFGCATSVPRDPGLEGLAVSAVAPTTIIPGTAIEIAGASFVEQQWGIAQLHLVGETAGDPVDVRWPARFVDFGTMTVAVDSARIDEAAGPDGGDFIGKATIEVLATSDGETYISPPLDVALAFRHQLTPFVTFVDTAAVIFVNDQIHVTGDGFLLGGDEGQTIAQVEGCFTRSTGGPCNPIAPIELTMNPEKPHARDRAVFPFSPRIAGISPGNFTGSVTVINRQTNRAPVGGTTAQVTYDLVTSQVFRITPPAASLGQYVFVEGGGFVGGEAGAITELELTGSFTRTGGGGSVPVAMTLIPDFVEGRLVRYVVNTDDALGKALDLRKDTGQFTGTVTPVVSFASEQRVRGVGLAASFSLAPIKQVVYLQFQPSYVEGLRDFGLRAVDNKIRDRIIEVCNRTYGGVNIEFRTEPPTDFALFENVELLGVDPNGTGLFGYDNTPGKDNGNLRLYDRLGGVNAITQQDGFPGFGGVFVRSLMGFSTHPGGFATSVPGADPLFDQIFDPFRLDLDNQPITSADLAGGIPTITDGAACPGNDRKTQIGCAVFVLGNLVGGTLAHEIGHSLGLANPFNEGFHNLGDAPSRLMDAGGDRPFDERAELHGVAPAEFCDAEYEYLRQILPTAQSARVVARPDCF